MSANECRVEMCGKPARDAMYFCEDCATELHQALGKVPELDEELEVTITGQRGVDYRTSGGTSSSAEAPSPVHWGASEARTHLRALLVSWVLYSHAEGVRHQSHHPGLPDDNLRALSAWLIWRIDGLALHEIGPDAVDEITDAVAHCHRLIDRPADRQYLGDCEETDCLGRMWGKPSAALARCDACMTTVSADAIRAKLLERLDDQLYTAADIAKLSTYLGFKATREQVRRRINKWHERGLLVSHPSVTAEVTFRFGEAYARLVAAEYTSLEKAG